MTIGFSQRTFNFEPIRKPSKLIGGALHCVPFLRTRQAIFPRSSRFVNWLFLALNQFAVAWVSQSVLSETAFAQRGQVSSQYSTSPKTPSSGFQGFFDAEQLDAGTFTGDLPSFSVDYGINERLSVGTNGLLLLGLPFGVNSILLKTRYRYYSDGRVVSALSLYGGGVLIGSMGYGYLGVFSSNTSVYLDSVQSIGLSLVWARFGLAAGELGDIDYVRAGVSLGFVSGQYRIALHRNILLEFLLGTFVAQSIDVDTAGQSLNLDAGLGALSAGSLVSRASADIRIADRVLLSPQLYILASFGNNPLLVPIPMFNATFRIGN